MVFPDPPGVLISDEISRAIEGTSRVARASSAYVHDGRSWKLAFHQQTPLPR